MSWTGRLLHIHIAERASVAMEELDEAKLIAGRGIEGDRYFNGIGTYSPKPDVREVTLIEMEVLDALARGDPPLRARRSSLRRGLIAATSPRWACRSTTLSANASRSARR